jgi:FKBP-type peptidyl-prolyl cis-trans isomerase
MKRLFAGLLLAGSIIAFFACNKDNSLEELRKNELKILDEYIEAHHPGTEPQPSGLYYFEQIQGSLEDTIKQGDRVQVFYATWRLDGANDSTLVDQSSGYIDGHRFEPLEFIVGASEVISGLDEGITYMNLGTVGNLVVPSELAYGQNGSGSIGGFKTLLMEVEVYKIYPLVIPETEE